MQVKKRAAPEKKIKGFKPYPFQVEGRDWFLNHERKKLIIADEMGLGKTVQSCMILNSRPELQRVLIICPAFLRLDWLEALQAFGVLEGRGAVQVIDSNKNTVFCPIVIAGFENAASDTIHAQLIKSRWDIIIIDELQYLKSAGSKRTCAILGSKHVKGVWFNARYFLGLSGTLNPNHGQEAYNILKRCIPDVLEKYNVNDHDSFKNTFSNQVEHFAKVKRKTGAVSTVRVKKSEGITNHELLAEIMSHCTIRREKVDVLDQLPARTHKAVYIEPTAPDLKELVGLERSLHLDDVIDAFEKNPAGGSITGRLKREQSMQAARIRRKLGAAKVRHFLAHILNDLEQVDRLFIVAYHIDTIALLANALNAYNPGVITGATPMPERQKIVNEFQNPESDRRVIIGQIKAVGVGVTLTAASLMWIIEPWYVPGDVDQVIARLHRIGQKNAILAKFAIVRYTLDEKIMERGLSKKTDISNLNKELVKHTKKTLKKRT